MPVINLVVDPYDVLKTSSLKNNGYSSNERYLKVDKLVNEKNRYNGFIIGSSVTGTFNPKTVSEYSKKNYYNLSFLGGYPKDALHAIKAIQSKGTKVDQVLLGVDLFWFDKELLRDSVIWKVEHPLVTGESQYKWYYRHLIGLSLKDVAMKIQNNLSEANIIFDVKNSGMYLLPERDRAIRLDEESFIKQKIALKRTGAKQHIKIVEQRMQELSELVAYLKQENIECKYFINPVNQHALSMIDEDDLEKVRARIKLITPGIIDISKDKNFTDNDHLYYDARHIKGGTADEIIKLIYR